MERAIKFAMHFSGTGGIRELPIFKGPPTDSGCPPSPIHSNKNPKTVEDKRIVEKLRKRLARRLRRFLLERPKPNRFVMLKTEGKN